MGVQHSRNADIPRRFSILYVYALDMFEYWLIREKILVLEIIERKCVRDLYE